MKSLLIFLAWFLIISNLSSQDKPAYKLFDNNGKSVSYSQMVKKLTEADIVFFGEYHNNPISHWLELSLVKDLYQLKKENLIIGAEMFEADNQLIIDEYMNGIVYEKNFEDECKLWPNYNTDYKPIILFAKENKIPFIATNIPRRYANIVLKNDFIGLNNLSDEAKSYIAPLPIKYDPNVECYKKMITEMGGMGSHNSETLPKAQAVKDATMSHFILKNWKQGKLFFHINGSYHSDNHQGICWYIYQQKPETKIITITTVSQENINELSSENENLADYIICVPDDMTNTNQ